MCFFWGGIFWHEQLIKFFLASTCDFSSLPLSLLLSALISTKPSQRCIRVPGHHSRRSRFPILFFFSFSGRGTLHNTSILSTYTYNPIFRDAERRERDNKRTKKKERKKRASSCLPYSNQNIHTYIPPYVHTHCWFQPPVRIQKSIVYLPTYLPTQLPNLPRPRQLP